MAGVLFDAGVQAAQGFHFSRPLAAADLIAFHHQTNGLEDPTVVPATE